MNAALFELFDHGRDWLQQGRCSSVRPLVDQIVSLMTVPLVQGALRYAYLNSEPGENMATPKNAAEGATFSAAVLPLVHHCNTASAAVVSDNLKFGLFPEGGDAVIARYSDFAAVKAAFEDVYACLGITCAQVGGLTQAIDAGAAAAAACAHQSAVIAGYVPGSVVTQHNQIDLDQKALEDGLAAGNFATAKTIYEDGGVNAANGGWNSMSKGSARTLQDFSTSAQGKMYDGCPGCPYRHYKMFYDYYGDFDYADKWVSAALAGRLMQFTSEKHGPNNFHKLGDAARVEAVQKGTAYMNVWMYVIREFEDAIDDCITCVRTATENNCNEHSTSTVSVHAWDEGVAFYTGSLEGTVTGGSSSGKLLYRLAEKRCANFGTCLESGTGAPGTSQVNSELSALEPSHSPSPLSPSPQPQASPSPSHSHSSSLSPPTPKPTPTLTLTQVNLELFKLFDTGRNLLQKGSCKDVRPVINQIVSLMTVPLVQGALRYAYKNSQAAGAASPKNAAEGATFSAAVLPLVHHCNTASAAVVSDNLKFGLFPTGGDAVIAARYSDFAAVKAAFEDVYACLGITCAHVGSLVGASGAMAQECKPAEKIVTESPYSVTARVTAAGSVTDYGPMVLAALTNPSPDPEPDPNPNPNPNQVLAALECSMADVARVPCDLSRARTLTLALARP